MKTKMIPVYHVEYAQRLSDRWHPRVIPCRDAGEAEVQRKLRDGVQGYACVKVTGPHQQEMPE